MRPICKSSNILNSGCRGNKENSLVEEHSYYYFGNRHPEESRHNGEKVTEFKMSGHDRLHYRNFILFYLLLLFLVNLLTYLEVTLCHIVIISSVLIINIIIILCIMNILRNKS